MKNLIVLILLCKFSVNCITAQDFCHSEINENNSIILEQILKNSNSKNYNGQTPILRLALHNVHRDNGTGGNSWQSINDVVKGVSDFFEPHGICFTVTHRSDINNDVYFNMINFGSERAEMIQNNIVDNTINIYFVKDVDRGGIATGFLFQSAFQPTDYPTVTLSNFTTSGLPVFNSQVLAHEIGHCLGLYHTHEPLPCREEIPRTGNIANCTSCGDLICDTPADPGLGLSDNNVDDAICQYIGGKSYNGYDYNPNTRNVMSYTLPHCMNHFTTGQGNRMRNFILNSTVFDDYVIPEDLLLSGNIYGDKFYGVESSISSTAFHVDGSHSYQAGSEIVLQNGFTISASNTNSFFAEIENYDCNTPLVENSGKTNLLIESIRKETESLGFSISPNPFTNELYVKYELVKEEVVTIDLYSNLGQLVFSAKFDGQKGKNISRIDLDTEEMLLIAKICYSDECKSVKLIRNEN